jgi:antitoxin YefM
VIALKTIDLRNNFRRVSKLVSSGERVLISRPHNENLVVLSEREYNELEKAKSNAEYLAMLDKSMNELNEGKVVVKTLDELEAMEQ